MYRVGKSSSVKTNIGVYVPESSGRIAMPDDHMLYEGYYLTEDDHMVGFIHVDLRPPADRESAKTLVKGCHKEHAIELSGKIRVSKPTFFRDHGRGLIMDTGETRISRTTTACRVRDDTIALNEVINEWLRANGLSDTVKVTVRDAITRITDTNVDTYSFGTNGWIFSTSMEPRNDEEWSRWQDSMDEDYDHVSHIYRPREFARALGSMVVDQLGPQGQEEELTHAFHGREVRKTLHRAQLIIHGPVLYVEDPYSMFVAAADNRPSVEIMRSFGPLIFHTVFVKGSEHRDQREYRFVIWTKEEPINETVDLDVSMAMMGAMQNGH